jgi:predicted O-linked N-acetylglucosamine transferase (SPINDLY family)|tara:strand:+ start:4370 stop:7225 length:2856 start_codon:yes stop_codon:yes gene_type:complete
MTQSSHVPTYLQKKFMDAYRGDRPHVAMQEAECLVQRFPNDAFSWKALGNCLLVASEFSQAKTAFETAQAFDPSDPRVLDALARIHFILGFPAQAIELQKSCLEVDSTDPQFQFNMANLLQQAGVGDKALPYLESAEKLGHDLSEILSLRSAILALSFNFQEAWEALNKLYALRPNDPTVHNNLANFYKDMANFEKGEYHYRRAQQIAPNYVAAYSNQLLSMHYDPAATVQDILELARAWQSRFGPTSKSIFPISKVHEVDLSRPIRVGLVSSNFHIHPVGWMVSSGLAALPADIELYAYSDSDRQDFINQRIRQCVTRWVTTYHLDDQQLAERIRDDRIDILIDLAGHGGGSRMRTMAMRPASLIVKWVGVQVSSMGIPAFDYFLSDHIETPVGVDKDYSEKLIRMPDDYICYRPPYYKPAITALPAIQNGYITLGCFNNPAKINNIVLGEWAKLMHDLPNSRLLLKGAQYTNPQVCERIQGVMSQAGIETERVILEGPVKHQKLLESYQRVDIALDPWPYSGGLTTCEAMLMGVPVVTLPGPTFAGRHSATHLINAGMPELVVNSWQEYRQRVIELASDLPSLAVIRASLRTYLEQSPVCDGERFARHLHKALRAIWQRYCEGKAPAALTFKKGGQAWFEDEGTPVKLPQHLRMDGEGFDWPLESTITVFDNGANLASRSDAEQLLGSGHIAILAFDPIERLSNVATLSQYGELHHYPQVTLGDGQPVTLLVGGDNEGITSLEPLSGTKQATHQAHPVASIELDSIEGLESIDLLVLDDRHDSLKILQHGTKALRDTLIIQVGIAFQPTHQRQPNLAEVQHWMACHGFRFYRFNNGQYRSYLPESVPAEKRQATELTSADAIFLPSHERMAALSHEQCMRLAFLLHTVYGIKDLAFSLLEGERSRLYLKEFITSIELDGEISKMMRKYNVSGNFSKIENAKVMDLSVYL